MNRLITALRSAPAKCLVGAIALVSYFIFLDTPYTGDDLAYNGVFGGVSPKYDSWIDYPRWMASHWLTTNGRMANYLMPLLGSLPKWLVALFCSFMLLLMYRLSVTLSACKNGFIAIALVSCIYFVLPWWDSMAIFDCQLNYVWASAMCLLAVWIIFTIQSDSFWFTAVSALICVAAGMMHEAASMPLCVGFLVYMLSARWKPRRIQWVVLAAFAFGTACVLFSPGIILRAGSGTAPDDPLWLLLIKSDLVAAALWLFIVILALSGRGRKELAWLFTSRLCIFVVAALVSMAVSLASGVVGRSGWFAELFAMIAVFGWLGRHWHPQALWASTLVSLVTVAQIVFVALWQHRLSDEFSEFETKYVESSDGVVFMDYTRDDELPWWTLGRLRGVLDPDDGWLLECHAAYYRADEAWPVVLPLETLNHLPLSVIETRLSNGDLLVSRLPEDAVEISSPREGIPIMICEINGIQWVAQSLPGGGWHLSPRMLDPGDR